MDLEEEDLKIRFFGYLLMESKDRQSTCMFLSIDPEFNGPNMFCMFSDALSPLQFYVSHLGIGDKTIK